MPDDDGSYLPELRLVLRLLSESRGQAIMDYVAARRPRQEARLDQFADEAEAASGLTFEALLQRSLDDDSRSDLTQEVLEQASRTVAEVKMRALGRALALGLLADDDAAVDEVNLMLAALRDLEVPHIGVLHRLYSEGTRYEGIVDYELASMFRNGTQVLYPILKTLERHGLAGDLSGTPTNRPASEFADPDRARVWAIWDFGILLIDRLLEVGEADGP